MADVKQVQMMDLLNNAAGGAVVLPDFQRDFVWERKQIEELLNSVINNYFIGSLLLLESSIDNLRFAPRLIRGVDQNVASSQKHNTLKYVLDGQQRITSLFYSFFEPNVTLSDETGFICKFYIRPDTMDVIGLADIEDIARRLRLSADIKKMFYESYNQTYGIDIKNLPTMNVFKNQLTLDQYFENNPRLSTTAKDNIKSIFDKIQKCTIPIITLPTTTSDDDIVNIFERINRTGTRLGIFELAVAKYYPVGIKLNQLKHEIKTMPFLEFLEDESVLKVMALLKELEPKPQNLIRLIEPEKNSSENQAEFYTLWHEAVKYLEKAFHRIKHTYGAAKIKVGKRNLELIPYTSMLIPLSVFLREIEHKGNSKVFFDKVDLWYWLSVFTQRYNHAVDSKSFSDMRSIRDWINNDETKPDLSITHEHVKNEMLKAARTSALAKGFYNFLILNSSKDLLTGQDVKISECHVDHLFPSSKYRGADCIFNLTLLDKTTNQKKKDKVPSEFISDCLESHGNDEAKLLSTLESHFISRKALDAMRTNNLDGFIQARSDMFMDRFKAKVI
ncbi:MAG TPA: GmrSD restriction endonuclease domain-containing protein [Candidatus Wunengus sp. YC64]|uniref:GmrSD restriction endonuclease domain-containing protein n=2 Tax=unclassified Candidatus Wunengus TaxID=3367695 RepID=UPI004028C9DA